MNEMKFDFSEAIQALQEAGLLRGVMAGRGGKLTIHRDGDLEGGFHGATLDSRTIEAGQLFVALPGTRTDGRKFVPQMAEQGNPSLVEVTMAEYPAPGLEDHPLMGQPAADGCVAFLVTSGRAALSELGTAWARRLNKSTVGVTGTNGKTTTKDFLAAALSGAGTVHATAGNYNNDLGVPLTLLNLSESHDFAVIEMGASAQGEIRTLARMAQPQVAVITNASAAHLDEFGSLETIVQTKGEILEGLPADGTAILNADDPAFSTWHRLAPCPVLSFGRSHGEHRWTWKIDPSSGKPRLTLDGTGWTVPLTGEHNGANLAAAILAARAMGLDDDRIGSGLDSFRGSAHRGVVLAIAGRHVLDDSYNANPESMVAAGRAVGMLPGNGKVVAVLGAMAELGPDSENLHRQTGENLAVGPVQIVVAVGSGAEPLAEGFDAAGAEGHYCATQAEAARLLASITSPGDRLLIKGSRSAAMEKIVPMLEMEFQSN